MSAPINLDKKPDAPKKDPYWKVVGVMSALFVLVIVGFLILSGCHHNSSTSHTAPTGETVPAAPHSTTNPGPLCNPGDKPYNGLGEDDGSTLCFTAKQWTIYQNLVDGKQKAADHKFAEAFKATGMTSTTDRQGFAVDYQCEGTVYDENSASAVFSGKSALDVLSGKVKESSDFVALRGKVCGYPTHTTPPSSYTGTLAPKCPPSTSNPACHELPPGASAPRSNPPTPEPNAPATTSPATGDPLG